MLKRTLGSSQPNHALQEIFLSSSSRSPSALTDTYNHCFTHWLTIGLPLDLSVEIPAIGCPLFPDEFLADLPIPSLRPTAAPPSVSAAQFSPSRRNSAIICIPSLPGGGNSKCARTWMPALRSESRSFATRLLHRANAFSYHPALAEVITIVVVDCCCPGCACWLRSSYSRLIAFTTSLFMI